MKQQWIIWKGPRAYLVWVINPRNAMCMIKIFKKWMLFANSALIWPVGFWTISNLPLSNSAFWDSRFCHSTICTQWTLFLYGFMIFTDPRIQFQYCDLCSRLGSSWLSPFSRSKLNWDKSQVTYCRVRACAKNLKLYFLSSSERFHWTMAS